MTASTMRRAAPIPWRAVVGTVVAVAGALSGCGRPAGDTSLFPLDAGHRWTYRVTTDSEDGTALREDLEMSATGRDDIDGIPTWKRRSDDGAQYWLRSDDTGVFRVASKSDIDAEPALDAQRRYVLKQPYAPGTQWRTTTTAYLLQRRQDFPREVRYTNPSIPMNYTIEATGERLETPVGVFEGCLRVKGLAEVKVFADPVVGWRDLVLTTREWYCPGVGLARLEREEPGHTTFISGGRLTMELTDYR